MTHPRAPARSIEERTDIFAKAFFDLDIETRFGGYFERGSGASGSLVKHQPNALATQQRPRLATLHAARQAEYFKNFLAPEDGFRFTERPPQARTDLTDAVNPNALFVPFTIQLGSKERIFTNE